MHEARRKAFFTGYFLIPARRGGSRYNWWCESSNSGNTANICNVNNNGNPNNNNAANTNICTPV